MSTVHVTMRPGNWDRKYRAIKNRIEVLEHKDILSSKDVDEIRCVIYEASSMGFGYDAYRKLAERLIPSRPDAGKVVTGRR